MRKHIVALAMCLISGYSCALTNTECLSLAIYKEANTQSLAGKRAVANVILNRANKKNKSICAVVFEKYQFSWTRKKWKKKDISYHVVLANRIILMDKRKSRKDNTHGATHFHNKKIKPSWARKMRLVVKIEDHVFYKERKNV